VLDSEDHGDVVRGPGTDLAGVMESELGGFAVEGESFAQGSRELSPVQFEDFDVGRSEHEMVAIPRIAGANSDQGGLHGARLRGVAARQGWWVMDDGRRGA